MAGNNFKLILCFFCWIIALYWNFRQTENSNEIDGTEEREIQAKLPKYFPDLQGENRGLTPGAGWYQNEFLPWIQNQDPKKLVSYGIGLFLLAGT